MHSKIEPTLPDGGAITRSLARRLPRHVWPRRTAACLAVLAYMALLSSQAHANCTTANSAATCDTGAPSPWTTMIGAGPNTASGASVTVGSNAQVIVGDTSAIALGNQANIVVQSGALVQNSAVSNKGTYGTGANTIDFGGNSTLTVEQGATVLSSGTEGNAEAVNPEGAGNTIVNNGTIRAMHAAAIWFQTKTGSNTVVNNATGVIETDVANGNVLGSSGNAAVDFTNRGKVVGNLVFAGGDDSLHLYNGSSVSGSIDGGAGNNLITLNGSGSDMLPTITRFQTLQKQDDGTWTVANSLSGMGVTSTEVQQGTLVLTGNNSAYSGSMLIDAAGTLQSSAQSMPLTVTDNGLVRFQQDADGIYRGSISGSGAVEKSGTGTLTLDGANTYAGGTTVSEGALAVGDPNTPNVSITGPTSVASGAVLGGYGSVNGDVNNNGTLAVANAMAPFASNANGGFVVHGRLTNAGTVQLGGGQTVGNTLTVGSYVGNNGILALNTVLAGDNAASDKLVVDGGTATGATTLKITNVGGQGAAITSNGILVVQAANGATTDASAFTLAGGTMKAGAYEYYLVRGGVTAGTSEDWYLRNTLTAPAPSPAPSPAPTPTPTPSPAPAPAPSPTPTPAPTPTPTPTPSPAPTPAPAPSPAGPDTGTTSPAAPDAHSVVLYRPEAALYAAASSVTRQLGVMQLDNFHLRQGDQSLLAENGNLPAAWGRVWGGHSVSSQGGDVNPRFSGSLSGAQVGHDLYAVTSENGHRDHYGVFVGFARADGDVRGFAEGAQNLGVGQFAVDAYSAGGYWSHIAPGGWYTDAVLMGSTLTLKPVSRDGMSTRTHGHAVIGSFEGGYPFALGHGVTLEPQAQVIWQQLSLHDFNDGVSNVSFSNGDAVVGRFGVRVFGSYTSASTAWQPYVRLNLLRAIGSNDTTTFDGSTSIVTPSRQSTAQVDVGCVAKFSQRGSVYASVSYSTSLGGEQRRTVAGNVGLRWAW